MNTPNDPQPIGYIYTQELHKKYPTLFSDIDSKEPIITDSISKNELKKQTEINNQEDLVEQKDCDCDSDFSDDSGLDTTKSLEEIDHDIDHGAFELNFSEFPIAHLTSRLPKGVDKHKIQYKDHIRGRDGCLVERNWTIKSSADHGLGGPSSINVLFEVMQIWKEQGFLKDKIYIGTYYNLVKRLGWDMCGKSYKKLQDDLESIYGLEIIAENAYYDKELGKYVDKKVKPFIGWAFWKEHQIKDYMTDYGYIQVHPDFFSDFRKKSLYYLPFENQYLKQLSSHEQKLALYLTKIFNPYRKKVQYCYKRNINDLCSQLNIHGTNNAKMKYYLTQAAKSLIKRGFILLERYEIEEDSIKLYNRLQQSLLPYLNPKTGQKNTIQIDLLVDDIMKVCGDRHSEDFYRLVAKKVPDDIIYECLSEAKQEGTSPKKLFTYLITNKAKRHLDPLLKSDNNQESNE